MVIHTQGVASTVSFKKTMEEDGKNRDKIISITVLFSQSCPVPQ